jgi:integrase
MAKASDHLWKRGNVWNLRLAIPRKLQHHFLSSKGKPLAMIVEPLGDSPSVAKIAATQRVAYWTQVFDRVKAGESYEDIKRDDAFREQLRIREQATLETVRQSLPDYMMRRLLAMDAASDDIRRRFPDPSAPAVAAPALTASNRQLTADLESKSETVSQAAAAMYAEMERDKRRQTTIDGHKLRVRAFVDVCGDMLLTAISRATASDWLDKIGAERSNRTRNAYAMTMALVIETARRRGRYQGENPFDGMKAQASGESYQAFTEAELATLFRALPREVKPAKHSPETALPWVALIAAYTGCRLEEIAQLAAKDIREQQANGATITVIDIHNGGNNALKNKASARLIPVHSALVRAGLLRYVAALPKGGPLFPGLKRRASKGGKIGARVGELFRKLLIRLNLKRDGLCFHSFRHTVAGKLEQAGVAQTDAARVLGHAIEGMSYGVYSTGPGLKRLAAVVEEIHYDNI